MDKVLNYVPDPTTFLNDNEIRGWTVWGKHDGDIKANEFSKSWRGDSSNIRKSIVLQLESLVASGWECNAYATVGKPLQMPGLGACPVVDTAWETPRFHELKRNHRERTWSYVEPKITPPPVYDIGRCKKCGFSKTAHTRPRSAAKRGIFHTYQS